MKINNENIPLDVRSRAAAYDSDTKPSPLPAAPPKQTERPTSNQPLQKQFTPIEPAPRNASQALVEINDTMTAITGRNNLKQYDSLASLRDSLGGKEGRIIAKRIENALIEARRIMDSAYRRLVDPNEKARIVEYLSTALATDDPVALEEAYLRLRNTGFNGSWRLKNMESSGWNSIIFFERRDKSKPLPDNGENAPLVFVNPKDPRKMMINLEVVEKDLPGLLKKQSSAGYNRELVDAIMGQITRLDDNTREAVPIRREATRHGLSLASAQTALTDFRAYRGPEPDAEKTRFLADPVFRADEMTANTESATIYLRDIGLRRPYNESVTDDFLDRDEIHASFDEFSEAARALYASFPDPLKIARALAGSRLRERTGLDLDPDKVYLHQFEKSQTEENPDAFTGYAHRGKPKYSETLTQAYMDNFKIFRARKTESFWDIVANAAGKQVANGTYPSHLDNPDLKAPFFSGPDVLTGLYTENADAGNFGPHNEVKYRPSDLQDDIFDANVMTQIEDRQKEFWRENKPAWRSLAKGQFIEEARRALAAGTLSKDGYETAINGGAPNIVMYDPVSLRDLQEAAAPAANVRVNFLGLKIPSYFGPDPLSLYPGRKNFSYTNLFCNTNILCMTGTDGREVIYVPGDNRPFHEFPDSRALNKWFIEQLSDDGARSGFLAHFSLSDRQQTVEPALDGLTRATVRPHLKPSVQKIDLGARYGTNDAFSTLAQLTEERATKDADTLIQSNGEVRLQSAKNILDIVNLVSMPILPILGPVGLALDIGLAAAQSGVNIGIAASADTLEEREAAVSDAARGFLFAGISAGLAAGSLGAAAKRPPTVAHAPWRALIKTEASGRSFGDDLDFPWIDEPIETAQAALHRQLFSTGPGAARLAEFYKNPTDMCYDAMVEAFDALGRHGEKPKVIGMLIYKNPWDETPTNHFATLVKRGDASFVVDPTIRQFDASLPESATIQPLDQWESFIKDRAGSGDAVIVLDSFDSPLRARQVASDLHNVTGKYYQTGMMAGGDVNVLKYNDKFENSIIRELEKNQNMLRVMKNDPQTRSDIDADISNLRRLKARFELLSPAEIERAMTIRGKLRSEFLKDAVSDADVGAFRAKADDKGVVTTVSGRKYIKIGDDAFVNFSYNPSNPDIAEISGQGGRNPTAIQFDSNAKRWVRSRDATSS